MSWVLGVVAVAVAVLVGVWHLARTLAAAVNEGDAAKAQSDTSDRAAAAARKRRWNEFEKRAAGVRSADDAADLLSSATGEGDVRGPQDSEPPAPPGAGVRGRSQR